MTTEFFTIGGKYEVQERGLFFNGECIETGDVYINTLILGLPARINIKSKREKNYREVNTGLVRAVLSKDEVYAGEKNPIKKFFRVSGAKEGVVLTAIHEAHALMLAKVFFGNLSYQISQIEQDEPMSIWKEVVCDVG